MKTKRTLNTNHSATSAPVPPEHNCKRLTAERASGNF